MTHKDYVAACQRTEHRDQPARLLHLETGEVGMLRQCYGLEQPASLLVETAAGLTTWWPEGVRDISDER